MKVLPLRPKLVEQVVASVLDAIASGSLVPGERIVQDQIAQALGVSRQPVQQALLLLRNHGVLRTAPGRGLMVAPLDGDHVRHVYEMRAALEGLAVRSAAQHVLSPQSLREGQKLIAQGRKAAEDASVPRMIAADTRFHEFLYGLSGNPLLAPALVTHLIYTQRVMGEVLVAGGEQPRKIWDEHAAILAALEQGDPVAAQQAMHAHLGDASALVLARRPDPERAHG